MHRFRTVVLISVGMLALAGLAFAYLGRPDAGTAQSSSSGVTIKDYSFQPATLRIAPGATVAWTNRDAVRHTVTERSEGWSSDLLAQGESYYHTFTEVGTYEYFCEPHPWMRGRIVVGDAPDDAAQAQPPAITDGGAEQMREMMEGMHGPGSFEAMREWVEEHWGPDAFEAMLQGCPHGQEGTAPGESMMGGASMMGDSDMAPGRGMTGGGGMMSGDGGGMMGGPRQ